MASQLSLSQVIQYFAGLAAQDKRINSFGYGPISDISSGPYFNVLQTGRTYNLQTNPPVYPLMWCEPDVSTLRTDSILLKHKLHFVDLVNKDTSNRLDVASDALQAALEIKAFIQKDFFYEIFPDDESELTPIFEKYDDEVTGYIMQCNLQMDWLADVCNIPGLYPSGATFQAGPGYYSVALNGYLPLVGGTLTGPLYGTCGYFNCFSATSLSASSIYSGSTNISELFLSIYTALGSATTLVQNGLNTYTGGTIVNPTINISGGTFDNLNVTGATVVSGLTGSTFLFRTGVTKTIELTEAGNLEFIGGNGTNSQIAIHQNAVATTLIDMYNNSYSKLLFRITDNGSAGQVNIANSTMELNTYTNNVGIGIGAGSPKLRLKADSVGQDILSISPLGGNGGVYFNNDVNNNPYFYLQPSAGTGTNIAIYSSGFTYFNGGNVGFGSTAAAQDAIHIYNGTIRINDTGSTYGAGKIAVSDSNGSISFSAVSSLATGSQLQNGLNTYTAGTSSLPSVNVSALTINTLRASGNTILSLLSATTINATNAGTGGIVLRGYTSDATHSTIYMRQPTPSGINYALYSDGNTTNLNSPTTLNLAVGGSIKMSNTSTLTSISNGTLFNGYSYNLVTSGQSNSAQTINWALSNNFDYTITANTTFTFSNTRNGETIVVAVSNNTSTSGLTSTFTAGTKTLKWQGAVTPTQTTTTGKTDIYTFIQSNAIIYGVYSQSF